MKEIAGWTMLIVAMTAPFAIALNKNVKRESEYRDKFYASCLSDRKRYECDALYSMTLRGRR